MSCVLHSRAAWSSGWVICLYYPSSRALPKTHTFSISIPGFFLCSRCFSCCLPFFFFVRLLSSELCTVMCMSMFTTAKNSKRKQHINAVVSMVWTPMWEHSCKGLSSCEKPACMHMDRISFQKPTRTVRKVPPARYCSQPCHKIMQVVGKELQPLNSPGSNLTGNTRTSSINRGPTLKPNPRHSVDPPPAGCW